MICWLSYLRRGAQSAQSESRGPADRLLPAGTSIGASLASELLLLRIFSTTSSLSYLGDTGQSAHSSMAGPANTGAPDVANPNTSTAPAMGNLSMTFPTTIVPWFGRIAF